MHVTEYSFSGVLVHVFSIRKNNKQIRNSRKSAVSLQSQENDCIACFLKNLFDCHDVESYVPWSFNLANGKDVCFVNKDHRGSHDGSSGDLLGNYDHMTYILLLPPVYIYLSFVTEPVLSE